MNVIQKHRIVIEYDVWEPMAAKVRAEEDNLLASVKEVLQHAGNIKARPEVVDDNA